MAGLDSLIECGDGKVFATQDKSMQPLLYEMWELARESSPVLIQGETGTGKGLIARFLHAHGPRDQKPFVRLNCGGIPEPLLEAELFGYEKGAFTGASAARKGILRQVDGGTLFLDEIGDMPLALQAKILTAIEEREVVPLGASSITPIPVDFRLVSATHRDLESLIHNGTFREDLYYRISTYTVCVPPLRERPDDIPLIGQIVLKRINEDAAALGNKSFGSISADAEALLRGYGWHGNVRELENVLRRAALRARIDPTSNGAIEGRHVVLPLHINRSDVPPTNYPSHSDKASYGADALRDLVLPVTLSYLSDHYNPVISTPLRLTRIYNGKIALFMERVSNKEILYIRAVDMDDIPISAEGRERLLEDIETHGFVPTVPHRIHNCTTLSREPVGLSYFGLLKRIHKEQSFYSAMKLVVLTQRNLSVYLRLGYDPAPALANLAAYHSGLMERMVAHAEKRR